MNFMGKSSSQWFFGEDQDQDQNQKQMMNTPRGRRTNYDASVAAAADDDDNDHIRRGYSPSDGQGLGVGVGVGARAREGTSSTVSVVVEREHMFDKVVTPSDVGKLNRLVIPKQHAEKYFPLDSSTNEKGLLLNFEDRNGKPWRFRYSYWNSSQSYVMTKGWSRFVKEKKLDAGDIVSFQRGVGVLSRDRLFIDWRRRSDAPQLPQIPSIPTLTHFPQHYFSFHRSTQYPSSPSPSPSPSPFFLNPPQAIQPSSRNHSYFPQPYPTNRPHSSSYTTYGYGTGSPPYGYNTEVNPSSSPVIYLRSAAAEAGMLQMQSEWGGGGGGGGIEPMIFESVPVVQGKATSKRLRLFGVNMDCPISESNECHTLSSTTNTIAHATVAAHPPHHHLRLYNGHPLPPMQSDLLNKGKVSNKSFDLDI